MYYDRCSFVAKRKGMRHLRSLSEMMSFKNTLKSKWIAIDVEGSALSAAAVGFGENDNIAVYNPREIQVPANYFSEFILVGCGVNSDRPRLLEIESITEDQRFIDIQMLARAFGLPESLKSMAPLINGKKMKSDGNWLCMTDKSKQYLYNDVLLTYSLFENLTALSKSKCRKGNIAQLIIESVTSKPIPFNNQLTVQLVIPNNPFDIRINDIKQLIWTKHTVCNNQLMFIDYSLKLLDSWIPIWKIFLKSLVFFDEQQNPIPFQKVVDMFDASFNDKSSDYKGLSLLLAYYVTLLISKQIFTMTLLEFKHLQKCTILSKLIVYSNRNVLVV